MTYIPHLRVTLTGILGTAAAPVEEFSFGFALNRGTGGTPTGAELSAIAQGTKTAYAATIQNLVAQAVRLKRVRVSDIGTNGRTIRRGDGSFNHEDSIADLPGQAGVQGPPQISLVVSMYTAVEDLTGRGRMYIPMPGQQVEADSLRLTQAAATTWATEVRSFLNQVATLSAAQNQGGVVLASQGSVSRGIPQANRPITQIRVGRVLDTMRSRRSQLDEQPSVVNFPS